MFHPRIAGPAATLTLTLTLTLIGLGGTASAGFSYHVVVKTNTITPGTVGSLEFQYNPAMMPTSVGSAVVGNFTTIGGVVSPTTEVNGSVSGDLTKLPMTLKADTSYNDLLENFTYGSSFAFDVTFNGTPSPADRFSLTLWSGNIAAVDGGTATQLFSSDPSGAALLIDNGGPTSVVSYRSPQVSVVPEPSSLTLLALAGAGLMIRRGGNRRGRAA